MKFPLFPEDGKYLYRGENCAMQSDRKTTASNLCNGQKEGYGRGISASNETYRLRISYAATVNKFPDLDPYPYGELSIDGKQTKFDLNMRLLYSGGKQ